MYVRCKFCGKVDKNHKGLCQQCYNYFCVKEYDVFDDIAYGRLSFVEDENHIQYGMPICHICGRAYTKLQQHIYYAHKMSKVEYCDMFGLDRGIQMTSDTYHQKMRKYAFQYNMDEQLLRTGKNTRFKKGMDNNYERSFMTKERLRNYGKTLGYKNLKNCKEGNQ